MGRPLTSAVRATAFIRKEAAEAFRQPRLLLTLVIGPFVILLIFGAGLRETDPPFRTLFVAPPDDELVGQVTEFAERQSERLTVEGVTNDEDEALRRLQAGAVQLVIVFPSDVGEKVRANKQATILLYHNQLDPIEEQAVQLYMLSAVDEVNQQILAAAIEGGQSDSEDMHERVRTARERVAVIRQATERDEDGEAALELARLRSDTAALMLAAGPAAAVVGSVSDRPVDDGAEDVSLHRAMRRFSARVDSFDDPADLEDEVEELESDLAQMEEALSEFRSVSPHVLVAPFRGQVVRVVGDDLDLSDFYATAVLVVLLQHMLITLVGLSIVREAELGTPELYRIAPLRMGEFAVGKHLAHIAIGALVAAVLALALVFGLGVPMHGSWALLAIVLLAVLVASSGLGFCVAAASRTDSQAVQYTMLLLLATIFFSGFTLSLERFVPLVRWVGLLLPATYGVELVRDVMLRGTVEQGLTLPVLVVFGVTLGLIGWLGVSWRLQRT